MNKNGNIIFSSFMANKPVTHKISYLALFAAFSAISNLLDVPIGVNQISLTIFTSAIIGVLSGGVSGFAACFIGDLIGFFVTKVGFAYSPFLGISSGLFALFAGLFSIKKANTKPIMYLKLATYCVLTFLVCTVLINTLYFYLAFSSRSVSFFTYVYTRVFAGLQFLNNLFNYALLILIYPLLKKIKFLS